MLINSILVIIILSLIVLAIRVSNMRAILPHRFVWGVIAMAFLLLAIERSIKLYNINTGALPKPPFIEELNHLVIAVLMLIGMVGLDSLIKKITQTKEEKESFKNKFEESHDRYKRLVENLKDQYFFYSHDTNGVFTYLSPSVTNVLGYTVDEFKIHYSTYLTDSPANKDVVRLTEAAIKGEAEGSTYEVEIYDKNKNIRCLKVVESAIKDASGQVVAIEGIAHDITERKNFEELLEYRAHYDHLTSLPNRILAFDRINQSIERSRRDKESFAIFFIDIDSLKMVNDTYGHTHGDRLLIETARRLKNVLRKCDSVARLSGDEFLVIAGGGESENAFEVVAQKIESAFESPFYIGKDDYPLKVSVGVAVYPQDGMQVADLLKHADQAMYEAKRDNNKTVCYYSQVKEKWQK